MVLGKLNHMQNNEIGPLYFTPFTKNKLKWITDLNIDLILQNS